MRILGPLALIAFGFPALAQDGFQMLEGQFGSATDPAASCGANPHELSIIDDRPHLARTWTQAITGSAGSPRTREVYDVVQFDGTAIALTEEGLYHDDPDGTGGTMPPGGGLSDANTDVVRAWIEDGAPQ